MAEHSCTAQDAISRREDVNCPLFYQKVIPKKHNVVSRYTSFTYTGFSCRIIQAAISDATCQHFWQWEAGVLRNWTVAEALQCMHAGRRCWEKAVYRHRSGEKTVGVKEDSFHRPLGLPLSRGNFQYLTLRDLSSHDQEREEGKVGREEAAVPKGPLPI